MNTQKKFSIATLMMAILVCIGTAASAQTFKDRKKIPQEQVPVAVQNAFRQEFASISEGDKGNWFVYYEQESQSGRNVIKPITYIYKSKQKEEKFEIEYDPQGKLESAKGVAKTESNGLRQGT